MDEEEGIWIIVDDPDELELDTIETVSGLNILSGCYGLFLIADERTTDYWQDSLLMQAFNALDDLEEHEVTVADAMYDVFPPADLSQNGILQLAKTIIELRDNIEKHPGIRSPVGEELDTMATINRLNELNERISQLMKEIKELQDDTDTTD